VVTPSSKTTPESPTEIPAMVQKLREQLMSAVEQSQQVSLDAAQAWVKAFSVLPAMDLPKIPGLPAMPGMEAATKYTFDVAEDLLKAQRDFSLRLTSALTPAK
jgi:hypothetical protein